MTARKGVAAEREPQIYGIFRSPSSSGWPSTLLPMMLSFFCLFCTFADTEAVELTCCWGGLACAPASCLCNFACRRSHLSVFLLPGWALKGLCGLSGDGVLASCSGRAAAWDFFHFFLHGLMIPCSRCVSRWSGLSSGDSKFLDGEPLFESLGSLMDYELILLDSFGDWMLSP